MTPNLRPISTLSLRLVQRLILELTWKSTLTLMPTWKLTLMPKGGGVAEESGLEEGELLEGVEAVILVPDAERE